jgi:CIC family chloride channel protein
MFLQRFITDRRNNARTLPVYRSPMARPWRADESPFRLAVLALVVGLVAGLGAVVFRALIGLFHNLFFFGVWSIAYDANVHTPPSPWGAWVVLIPVGGALIVAFLVKNFAPEAKGHGVPEVIDAIYYRRGVIRPVVALIKAVASSVSIGSGAAIGREGPIIQIGAAFGSTVGQYIRMPEWQRITLIAGGAAGGIAATFNTPIGGLLFAVELLLPEISARTLVPLAIATGAGTFFGQAFFGIHPSFDIPALALPAAHLTRPAEYAAYAILGVILGVASALFIRAIYLLEDAFDRMPGNYYTRHALGMFLVGTMMYLAMRYLGHYYVDGVGYATIRDVLTGSLINPYVLLLLFGAKLLATSLSLGSGASGGVFSPSLFLGAVLGGAYAVLAAGLLPGLLLDPQSAAVIGMAGMMGGATGAVVTAIVIIFEMTRDYNVIVPLLVSVSVAYGVRRLIMADSIYSLKLSRRGRYIPESLHTHAYMLRTAGDALSTPTIRVERGQALTELHRQLPRRGGQRSHVMITEAGELRGVLPLGRIDRLVRLGELGADLAEKMVTRWIVVHQEDVVLDVVGRMRATDTDVALVTRSGELEEPGSVLGILSWGDVVRHSNLPLHLCCVRSPSSGAKAAAPARDPESPA